MSNKVNVSIGDGFTLGSFVASLILIPAIACGGFVLMTVLGGTLSALLNGIGP
jgi:hypothetical protein